MHNYNLNRKIKQNDDQVKDSLPVLFSNIPNADAQGDRLLKNITKKLKSMIIKTFCKKNIQNTYSQLLLFTILSDI